MNHTVPFRFCLYVAGDAPNSVQAQSNLAALCQAHLPGAHEIEIVDVFLEPMRAMADGIFMTPTLVRTAPLPQRKIVGSLSQIDVVLRSLNLGMPVT